MINFKWSLSQQVLKDFFNLFYNIVLSCKEFSLGCRKVIKESYLMRFTMRSVKMFNHNLVNQECDYLLKVH